ncbi:MAG: chromosome segregation protein SMC [Lachnospiraceae bacterium]|nr:chromosome segregation protein SMC [Lachnospiraceae bacterium]
MYLKCMEIQGFKSFANKIRLELHEGVTGIVGPNGSGKSNVADAVRWVLGEQSARQLRGGNMQDVIFSGTENRKPLGFASVAITLDNSDRALKFDADEVTVTRRLYRSGESEYQLNGVNCRLRDINELFYDTGIGKEGYSIIGQGQIDQILSGKPEERRALFDEAAGIVKFKRRKAASLKKLEEEQSNLTRVNDIIAELEHQLGPLEKQAEKAGEYLKKRDQLRNLDIQLFLADSEHTEKQLKEISGNKIIARNQLAEINAAFEETRREYDQVEQQLETIDLKIADMKEQAQQAALKKQEAEGRVNVLKEQIHTSRMNSDIYRRRLEAVGKDRERRLQEQKEEKAKRDGLNRKLEAALAEKTEKEKAAAAIQEEINKKTRDESQGKNDTISLLNNRSSIREKMQRYDTMAEQIGIRKSELASRMLQMKGEADQVRQQLSSLDRELQDVTDAGNRKRQEIEQTEKQLEELKIRLDRQNKQLEIGQTAFHRESSRLESLRNITERYEGYGNSIKKVMEQKENNPGIHGVVADLIKTDKKYETAIETALGGSLQNIVTDNENTAKYLINYLKKGHYGRATFLPLTSMREEQAFGNTAVLREPGVLGKADELVSCDPVYRGVVRRLLGRTVVVDQIDHAIAVGRRYHQSVRMVTLEGELLSPGGSMTGGSFRYNSNLLGRRREIEELEKSVRQLKTEMADLQREIEENRTKRGRLRELQNTQNEELQKLFLRQNTARVNRDAGLEKTASFRSSYQKLQQERGEIEGQLAEIARKRSVISLELEESQEQESRLTASIRDLQEKLKSLREKEQTALREQDAARLSFSRVQQMGTFIDERLQTAGEELERLEEEKKRLESVLSSGTGDISGKEEKIEKILAEAETFGLDAEACKTAAEKLTEQKEELNRSHRQFFEKRDELSGQKNQMEQECFRLQSQEEKLNEARENQINYLYEEYELTPDQAEKFVFDEIPERGALRKDITALKTAIRQMGSVNVNAVEEYRELKERYDFLHGQQQDLIKAAGQLQGIIAELDEGMRRQFREKFRDIRTEFDKVFKELFGGGKGTLELADEEDILESGIVIISQPPGKKLQNMMQLSGGEKALTAIALLFAIQNLKPSPFCLLDEIEAALDDSNVGRFAGYLHKLTKHTQFIIITHRRGTMASADRLYGITMQEKGVSTLVSVDLIESQLDK